MPQKTIFIVEDDNDISELMQLVVESAGYNTKMFLTADKVEASVIAEKPSLIIMDLYINRLDGAKLVKKFKKNKLISNIPIVLVSAKTNLSDIAEKSGADGFLAKPFNVKDLNNIIKKLA